MKFAQIYNNKAHWIFEAEYKPEFAPDIVIVDVSALTDIKEGWDYDAGTNSFTEPIAPIYTIPQSPTIEEQLDQLKADNLTLREDNLTIMEVLATMYEEMLMKGTV